MEKHRERRAKYVRVSRAIVFIFAKLAIYSHYIHYQFSPGMQIVSKISLICFKQAAQQLSRQFWVIEICKITVGKYSAPCSLQALYVPVSLVTLVRRLCLMKITPLEQWS